MFDWVVSIVEQTGYLGVAFLMLLENVFPPIPSELIMPLAGFIAARGELNVVGVLLAGIVGSLAGAVLWYFIGRWLGAERLKRWAGHHGRWLTMSPEDVDRATERFRRHGVVAVLIGRLIPAVRTLISVPAGISRMPMPQFLLYSTIGTGLWTSLLLLAGYALEGGYHLVQAWVNPVSNVVVALLVLGYIYRVVTFRGSAVS